MRFVGIIPARYASSRFPGKPLAMLGGKTVIQRVYEQVLQELKEVYVATDDKRIADCVRGFGGQVIMTRADHHSGTERIAEALAKVPGTPDVVVNVQGDEPFIRPSQIATLCRLFDEDDTQIGTLGVPFASMDAVRNANSPKIVVDHRGFALYFSRSVIPYVRGRETAEWLSSYPYLKHIGVYAYRARVLRKVVKLAPAAVETAESLEQLRWLYYGYRIRVGLTHEETIGIDTPADLERAENFLAERAKSR